MKRVFITVSLVSSLFLCGCVIQGEEGVKKEENQTSFKAFNDQTYVWESFVITTNRVQDHR